MTRRPRRYQLRYHRHAGRPHFILDGDRIVFTFAATDGRYAEQIVDRLNERDVLAEAA